ncbi:MAG: PqqD family protein [Candidatus Cloacimonetes bacterium]|nr:PqqD family protein [Candidatus Cloacimonadota bacterium]
MASKIIISKNIKIRTSQPDCVLIFDPERDFFHELNPSASEMFMLLKKGVFEEQIIKHIEDKYDITSDDAVKTVKTLLKSLYKLGIISIKNTKENDK